MLHSDDGLHLSADLHVSRPQLWFSSSNVHVHHLLAPPISRVNSPGGMRTCVSLSFF